jgi:probable HAF family extracellular repeat protein
VTGISEKVTQKYDKKWDQWSWVTSSENAFVWTSAQGMKSAGNSVYPTGINSSGELSGTTSLNAAVFKGGKWTLLGTLPGGTFSKGSGLNDFGQVVGYGDFLGNPSNLTHAFLWTPASSNGTAGAMIDLGVFGSTGPTDGASTATAINKQGWVTGWTSDLHIAGGASHAFVWRPATANGTTGTMIDLGTLAVNPQPGLSQSEGLAINGSGVIVGDANPQGVTNQSSTHAVIWEPGAGGGYTIGDLNDRIPSGTGWTLTRAVAVNDLGQIVVRTAQGHSLLLTPTATLTAPAPVTRALRSTEVGPLLTEAIHRADTSRLGNVQIQVTSLGGLTLGIASGHTIPLDDNAAGRGWFVDPTPHSDAEFTTPGNQGKQHRMDWLTVREHEAGHLLEHEHEELGVMIDTLPAGSRRVPTDGIDPATRLDGRGLSIAVLDANEESAWIGGSHSGQARHKR